MEMQAFSHINTHKNLIHILYIKPYVIKYLPEG